MYRGKTASKSCAKVLYRGKTASKSCAIVILHKGKTASKSCATVLYRGKKHQNIVQKFWMYRCKTASKSCAKVVSVIFPYKQNYLKILCKSQNELFWVFLNHIILIALQNMARNFVALLLLRQSYATGLLIRVWRPISFNILSKFLQSGHFTVKNSRFDALNLDLNYSQIYAPTSIIYLISQVFLPGLF